MKRPLRPLDDDPAGKGQGERLALLVRALDDEDGSFEDWSLLEMYEALLLYGETPDEEMDFLLGAMQEAGRYFLHPVFDNPKHKHHAKLLNALAINFQTVFPEWDWDDDDDDLAR